MRVTRKQREQKVRIKKEKKREFRKHIKESLGFDKIKIIGSKLFDDTNTYW